MTVEEYLEQQPADRRNVLDEVRNLVNQHMPAGFEEGILYGVISWYVPLERFSQTYNRQPLTLVSLANQKNYMALYLMPLYGDPQRRQRFESAYRAAGKKLAMGKSCLRFKRWEDLAHGAIADCLRDVTLEGYVKAYQSSRRR